MNNSLAKEFTLGGLLKFAVPSILMMICMSLYAIVDGIFISRFVGTDALSASNIVFPYINILMGMAIMLGTGSSALIARRMGEGNLKKAKSTFTFIVTVTLLSGLVICFVSLFFLDKIIYALGSNQQLYPYCHDYLKLILIFTPACMLQVLFQSLFVTAGKPALGLTLTVVAGIANIILDYVFIGRCGMGISGAAWGTVIGYMIPAIFGLCYFAWRKEGLHFTPFSFDGPALRETCLNGSSEMVTNLSAGIITFLFNAFMMHYVGETGVAAMTIVLYGQFLFTALFLGFSIGVAPVISYNFGNQNTQQLKRILKNCMLFVSICSMLIFTCSLVFADNITAIFAKGDAITNQLALHGFRLFAISYLFAGTNIFASALFTALSDGKVSALISFLRTFCFILLGILWLPKLFQVDGIWLAVPFAEFGAFFVSLWFLRKNRKKYQYA